MASKETHTSNKQYQFDINYVPHNDFERNTCKYILTAADVSSRSKVVSLLKPTWKRGGVCKYPKVFQGDQRNFNGSKFKSNATKSFEKHNVDLRRATTKYKHT